MLKKTAFLLSISLTYQSFAGLSLSTEQPEDLQNRNQNQLLTAQKAGIAALSGATVTGVVYGIAHLTSQGSRENTLLQSQESIFEHRRHINSNASLTYSSYESTDSSDSENDVEESIPTIDLRMFNCNSLLPESRKIDLHPPYNKTPHALLKQEFYQCYRDYMKHITDDRRLHVITGTALKRSSPAYILQNNVKNWLQEDYFQKRIEKFWLADSGFFTIILKQRN